MLLANKRLDGLQFGQFREALQGAFEKYEFKQMLRERLNIELSHTDADEGKGLPEIIAKVIDYVERRSRTTELLQAARDERPDDASLFFFAQQFGLVVTDLSQQALERTVKLQNKYQDIAPLIKHLTELEALVCHIERPDKVHLGTGFLIGPGIVITCHHVVEEFIKRSPEQIVCRFDYKVMSDGTTLNPGICYRLSKSIDYSEFSPQDFQVAGGVLPSADQLDYALFHLKRFPDDHPSERYDILKRGCVTPLMQAYDFQPRTAIFIIHHPTPTSDAPHAPRAIMKYSQDTEAVLSVNQNKTRVFYTTNTEKGSSGAPCFNQDWELVALHQSGDPRFKNFRNAEYNQGIPFFAILNLLEQRGKRKYLDTPQSPLEGSSLMNDMSSETPLSTSHASHENKTVDGKQPSAPSQSVDTSASPPIQQNTTKDAEIPFTRNDFLDRLHKCSLATISRIISYFEDLPEEVLDESSKAKKIDALMRWVDHPDGPGRKALYNNYLRVIGKKNL